MLLMQTKKETYLQNNVTNTGNPACDELMQKMRNIHEQTPKSSRITFFGTNVGDSQVQSSPPLNNPNTFLFQDDFFNKGNPYSSNLYQTHYNSVTPANLKNDPELNCDIYGLNVASNMPTDFTMSIIESMFPYNNPSNEVNWILENNNNYVNDVPEQEVTYSRTSSEVSEFGSSSESTPHMSTPSSTNTSDSEFYSSKSQDKPKRVRGKKPRKACKLQRNRKKHTKPRENPNNCLHLHEHLFGMLEKKEYEDCITWTNKSTGEFRLLNTNKVALLWGQAKNKPEMTYEKMARSIRYYYQLGTMYKVPQKRLHFKFGNKHAVWKKIGDRAEG